MKQNEKARAKWLISDELWEEIKSLLPKHNPYHDKIGGGPLEISDRAAMKRSGKRSFRNMMLSKGSIGSGKV